MAKNGSTAIINPSAGNGGGAFLTQTKEKYAEVKNEINDLEQLLAAAGQTSQSTLLLKKRKEMREVDESLELMKKDHKKRMDECEERRLQFEVKQAKMREQVLKFEKFIQENDAKRIRAELKVKQEKKLFEEKVKEISLLMERIQKLEEDQKLLSNELVKKSCYKAYLERIVEEGEYGYEEIPEILNRHYTLKQANKDLLGHSENLEQQVDVLRRNLQALKTEKQNQLLVSTSVLQRYQDELEKMRSQVKLQEEENLLRENKKKDVSREFTQTIQAIRNLYGRCYSTMGVKSIFSGPRDNMQLQEVLDVELDVISARMTDLIEITEEYKQELVLGMSTASSGGLPVPPTNTSTSVVLGGEKEMPSMASLPPVGGLTSQSASKSVLSANSAKKK